MRARQRSTSTTALSRLSEAAARAVGGRIEGLEQRLMLSAAPVPAFSFGTAGSAPRLILDVGPDTYFTTTTGAVRGLWKTDGTAGGTVLLKDFGTNAINAPQSLTRSGSAVYFTAGDGNGRELWRTDGTPAGTAMVADVRPGTGSSSPAALTDVGGVLYFAADDGTSGSELWRSDGTAAGTTRVKDVYAGSPASAPSALVEMGGVLYFAATDGSVARELWRSDGTAAGTTVVKDIFVGLSSSAPTSIRAMGGALYFAATDGTGINGGGVELWKSDGTAAGTARLKDISAGTTSSSPAELTVAGTTLYFTASDSTAGLELWKTDGTAAGTVRVKDVRGGSTGSSAASLTAVGGSVYFSANDGSGAALWTSDGTSAGTIPLPATSPANLTAAAGRVFFTTTDPATGTELWSSTGTTAGTALVADLNPLAGNANPTSLAAVNGGARLMFAATDGLSGEELYATDGTAAGTAIVSDVESATVATSPTGLFGAGASVYFGTPLGGLWRSGPSGTARLGGVTPTGYAAVGGVVYVSALDAAGKPALFRTDGTPAGTSYVRSFIAGAGIGEMTAFGGQLYFAAPDTVAGTRELWRTDGTAAGTVRVVPGTATTRPSNPVALSAVGSSLYFYAADAANGPEMWKTDGTAAGTAMVANINPAAVAGSAVAGLAGPVVRDVGGGVVVFPATSTGTGADLWRSDGTAGGTYLLKAGVQLDAVRFADTTAVAGGRAYFVVAGGLWSTDGTAAGTARVAAIDAWEPATVYGLTAAGGRVFFVDKQRVAPGSTTATYPEFDLWQSDGTPAGTAIVKRLFPTTVGTTPGVGPMVAAGGAAYLVGWNGADGAAQLWEADAAAPVAVPLGGTTADAVAPAATAAGDVYFAANGTLWRATTPTAAPAAPAGLTATPAGPFAVALSWADAASDETGYLVERSTTADFSAGVTSYARPAGATSYSDEVLQPATRYYYRVRAFNGAGASAPAAADATTPAAATPTFDVSQRVAPGTDWILAGSGYALGNQIVFAATSATLGTGLVRSDGTTITPLGIGVFAVPTVVGNRLFYVNNGALWVTDGSPAGTRFVKAFGSVKQMYAFGGRLYFGADDGTGLTAWTTDGTTAGTVPATSGGDRRLEALFQYDLTLTGNERPLVVGDLLYYKVAGTNGASQLWRSDGTPGGTFQLTNALGNRVYTASDGQINYNDSPTLASAAYGRVYFFARAFDVPTLKVVHVLWTTDGTVDGTRAITQLPQGDASRGEAVNGRFVWMGPRAIWSTDGTEAGTAAVRTFPADPLTQPMLPFATVAGRTYFSVRERKTYNPNNGTGEYWGRLWSTDGTAAGTTEVPDQPPQVNDTTRSHQPAVLAAAGGALYFGADIGPTLAERLRLYRLVPSAAAVVAPAAPTDVLAVAASGEEVIVTWTDNADAEHGYRVERSRDAAFATVEATANLGASTVRYADGGLVPGTTYYYRVTALGVVNSAPAPAAASVTTPVGPLAPSNLTAVNAIPGEAVDLAWTDNAANETGYVVQRSTSSAFDPPATITLNVSLPAGATAYRDATVARLTTYFYRVFATNAAGNSGSAKVTIATPESKPFAPTGLAAVAAASDEIDLTWTDASPNESATGGYRVERAGANGVFAEIAQLPANATSYVDDFVPSYAVYTYRVRAVNAVGASAYATVTASPLPPLTNSVASLPASTDYTSPRTTDATKVFQFGDKGYFSASSASGGRRLYTTDGTAAGTTEVTSATGGTFIPYLDGNVGMVEAGGVVYFIGYWANTISLWRTDGTPAGTAPVKAFPGVNFNGFHDLVAANGRVYLGITTSTHALWGSDGTAAGTVVVKDFGGGGGVPSWFGGVSPSAVAPDGTMYFLGDTTNTIDGGEEPYKSDGTTAGTVRFADVRAGSGGSNPRQFTVAGGRVYFVADDGEHGRELYVSDGTAAGTSMIVDLLPGNNTDGPESLTAFGGALVFSHGGNVYRTDGTAAGTVVIGPAEAGTNAYAWNLTPAGDKLYYTTSRIVGTQTIRGVWVADGTVGGATRLVDLPADKMPENLCVAGGALYWSVSTDLWRSDGTPAGTAVLRSFTGLVRNLAPLNGKLTFDVGLGSSTFWTSDGTAAGTVLVQWVYTTNVTHPDWMVTVGGRTYFAASTQNNYGAPGAELWVTDGTAAGTARLFTGPVVTPVGVGSTLYFASGAQVWKTDGTAAGTVKVADVAGYADVRLVAAVGGQLFMGVGAAGTSSTGRYTLWATDVATGATGAFGGTNRAIYLFPPGGSSKPQFAVSGGYLYFLDGANFGSPHGGNLWRANGASGTVSAVGGISAVASMADVGGTLYAVGSDPLDSLYKVAAGSPVATLVMSSLNPSASYPGIVNSLADVGGTLYFTAPDGGNGMVAWKSDGTAAGTVPVFDPFPDKFDVTPTAARPYGYTAMGGSVYFLAFDHYGTVTLDSGALWRSDGTAAGTTAVRSITVDHTNSGDGKGARPVFLSAVADKLAYADGEYLWRSDGTRLGTVRVDRIGTATDGTKSPATFAGAPVVVLGDALLYSGAAVGKGRDLRVARFATPAAPEGLTVADASSAAPSSAGSGRSLAWADRSTNESGFVLDRSGSPDFAVVDRSVFLPADATSYVDGTAAAGATYFYRVQAVNAGGASTFASTAGTVAPLTVRSWAVNDGGRQRSRVTSLTVTFDRGVTAAAGAFAVARRDDGSAVGVTVTDATGDGTTWTLTFDAAPGVVGGGLANGVYDLTVAGAGVRAGGAGGPAMAADVRAAFHRLAGDATGDGKVDVVDLGILSTAYGTAAGGAGWSPDADFTGDGRVDVVDLGILSSAYGSDLTAALAAPAPASTATSSSAVTTPSTAAAGGTTSTAPPREPVATVEPVTVPVKPAVVPTVPAKPATPVKRPPAVVVPTPPKPSVKVPPVKAPTPPKPVKTPPPVVKPKPTQPAQPPAKPKPVVKPAVTAKGSTGVGTR